MPKIYKKNTNKVTIITVVYNGLKELPVTISSVLEQTYNNVEYIVIDGNSTDGTYELIGLNIPGIDHWVSEPDDGIYDAMNKGCSLASGDYVIFMNAGDSFYTETSLSDVMSRVNDQDVIYCDYNVVSAHKRNGFRKSKDVTELWKGMITSHQAILFKLKSTIPVFHDLQAGLCADHALLIDKYIAGERFKYVDIILATYSGGGVSDIQRKSVYRSWFKNASKLPINKLTLRIYFAALHIREFLRLLFIKGHKL